MNRDEPAILLVEDDSNDALFLTMVFDEVGVTNPLHVIKEGREALAFLQATGKYASRRGQPPPYLVLLDLKLPRVMGLEVLKFLRARPEFDPTVVLVLTSSSNPEDIHEAYHLKANAYLVKPVGYAKLRALARAIKDFWLTYNQPAPVFAAVHGGTEPAG
jgi:CheY-like chemotaxis protein